MLKHVLAALLTALAPMVAFAEPRGAFDASYSGTTGRQHLAALNAACSSPLADGSLGLSAAPACFEVLRVRILREIAVMNATQAASSRRAHSPFAPAAGLRTYPLHRLPSLPEGRYYGER